MVTCTYCYEMVPKSARKASDVCPFCFHRLPEPEPTPVPQVAEIPQESAVYIDPTIAAIQQAQAAAAAAPKGNKNMVILGAVAGVLVLGLVLFFVLGRSESTVGTNQKEEGINPKLVPSLKALHKNVLAKTENFFKKTCQPFQEVGYNFTTQLFLKGGDWKALIEPGSGSSNQKEDWYLCPLQFIAIRSQADIKLKVTTRYQGGGLFGSAKSFATVALSGENLKMNFTLPTQEQLIENWSDVKGTFYIKIGFLNSTSDALKALSGAYTDFRFGREGYIKMHGVKLVQIKPQSGNPQYGEFEAVVPGWFGEARTKELRDWGTGCNNDVTEQFRKIAQEMIDRHDDLEEFKDSPQLKAYLEAAEKAGKGLCQSMPDVMKAIELYDQGKSSDVANVEASLKTALESARKTFLQDLEAQIDAIAVKK